MYDSTPIGIGNNTSSLVVSPFPWFPPTVQTDPAWGQWSSYLTPWTFERLVNRTDVHGQYISPALLMLNQSNNFTAPRRAEDRVDGVLNNEIVQRHYIANSKGDIIGLHAISKHNTSKWGVVDIDQHADIGVDAATRNLDAALAWCRELVRLGFAPLLLDSNGAGGYHILLIFGEPVQSSHVFGFLQWLVRDYATFGFRQPPETFPKQRNINEQRPYGSWWRLPGRHHTRDHWTRVWNDARWLSSADAIQAIIRTPVNSPLLIPDEARHYAPVRAASTASARSTDGTPLPVSERWRAVLAGKTPGGRHQALLELAGHLLGKTVDPHIVEELCVLWNAGRNSPPKDELQVRSVVQDLIQRDSARRLLTQHTPQPIVLRPQP